MSAAKKPGYLTSEFWLTFGLAIATQAAAIFGPHAATENTAQMVVNAANIATGLIVTLGYQLSRAYTKTKPDPAVTLPPFLQGNPK